MFKCAQEIIRMRCLAGSNHIGAGRELLIPRIANVNRLQAETRVVSAQANTLVHRERVVRRVRLQGSAAFNVETDA